MTQNFKFVFKSIANILGKGENSCKQHSLLVPQCFNKAFPARSLKFGKLFYKGYMVLGLGLVIQLLQYEDFLSQLCK